MLVTSEDARGELKNHCRIYMIILFWLVLSDSVLVAMRSMHRAYAPSQNQSTMAHEIDNRR